MVGLGTGTQLQSRLLLKSYNGTGTQTELQRRKRTSRQRRARSTIRTTLIQADHRIVTLWFLRLCRHGSAAPDAMRIAMLSVFMYVECVTVHKILFYVKPRPKSYSS